MEDVLEFYCPSTPRQHHRCPCPIHNGKDYNFSYMDKGYKCFSCGAKGDVITFVQTICEYEYRSDAMRRINSDFRLDLPLGGEILSATQSASLALKRAEAKAKKDAEEAWENEYHDLTDEWIRLDKVRRTADPMSDEYAEAVKKIDRISYMIDDLPQDHMLNPTAEEISPVEDAWGLDCGDGEKPKNVISNYLEVIRHDKWYSGIQFNEVGNRAEIHKVDGEKLEIIPWSDADEAQSMNYIEHKYLLYSKDKHAAALRILFEERRYNPIKDIVGKIKWDGKPRCTEFLTKWGKVEDAAYTREVSRLIFAGGIHRLYQPGCKFEDIPILIGDQGCGKSTLCRYLAINDDYFGELKIMEGQAAIENLSGKWILEIPEMSAFTKAKDQEAIKAFVSRQRDSYRKPYDRNTTELLRRCIFLATSNDSNPLVDKTGNRRWYPVECHCNGYDIYDHEREIRDYIMQCWAEAKEKIDDAFMQPFADRKLLDSFREAQENAMQDDWRVGAITDFLERKNPGELTCVRELCHRALSPNPDFPKEPSIVESKDIGKIMNRLKGWERVGNKRIGMYGVQRCWQKKEE
jgi:predicted P-loop ATPase